MKATERTIERLILARLEGLTLREAAAQAGVHVATVCRWQNRDPALRRGLAEAERAARHRRRTWPRRRPAVPWRRDCPRCGRWVVVRTSSVMWRFWRCEDRLRCGWASWRPRANPDCPRCGAAMLWSHSRKSIGCDACGMRIIPHSL